MRNAEDARVLEIIKLLKREYHPGMRRNYNPLQILVATILSAQCTDRQVGVVTRNLFRKHASASDYAKASLSELEKDVQSTGFYRNKAKNIKKTCWILVKDFDSKVPRTMEELLALPGVGRKTANIILAHAYGVSDGIAVDTHVKRLSNRLGLSGEKNPVKIEKDLMRIIPRKEWICFNSLLVRHGRGICDARKPLCGGCVLNKVCPSAYSLKINNRLQ